MIKLKRKPPSRAQLEEIVQLIREGIAPVDAARHAGVSINSVKLWYRIGKSRFYGDRVTDAPDNYAWFYLHYSRARIEGKKRLIDTIRVHANKDWKAAAYLLERLERSTFDKKGNAVPGCVFNAAVEKAKELLEITK